MPIGTPERCWKRCQRSMAATTISGVAADFDFEQELPFESERAAEILRLVPERPGVFALFGHGEADQPYVTRGANLRRRMARLLAGPETLGADGQPVLSKRLNLRERVARFAWCVTGSEFESLLVLYEASSGIFGHEEARRRMKLRTPYFLRLTMNHAHPRVYSTNRLSPSGLRQMYGPFQSRAAADRYADAVLDLFRLRRCYEDLEVSPEHPGCAYGEMKKCMAPCNESCSAEEYRAEAEAVKAFFDTHGESLLASVSADRERASEEMDFERAAELHKRWEKVKAAAGLADELVRVIPELKACVVQPAAALGSGHTEAAAVFLLEGGCLSGPERMSTLGVRAVREQTSVGSSLFAQPLMLQAVPLATEDGGADAAVPAVADSPEERAARVLRELASRMKGPEEMSSLSDHLSLLRRWYYRPEKQRMGEIFLLNADGSWPLRRILRGAARMVIGDPGTTQETDREAAKALRTKVLHPGREGVERVVPVTETRPASFRSRRAKQAKSAGGADVPAIATEPDVVAGD